FGPVKNNNNTVLTAIIFDGGDIIPRPLPPQGEFDINGGGSFNLRI
ncbi:23074_t:CDS:1, partial [Cetraspora pellucida]